ncbi:MAG: SH3 domain-containing protein [Xanthobacteraceae bacterium]|jgi:hypothetical protein
MSMLRIAAAAAILGALSVVDASAKPATVSAEVNLRKGPGTDTDVITLIPKGSTVEVEKCTNGWCHVTFEGQDGYAIAPNLGLGAPRPVHRPYGGDVVYGPGPRPGPGPAYVVGPPGYYYGPGPYYYGPGPGPYYWGPWGRPWGWGWGRRW